MNSEQSTRSILSTMLETTNSGTVNKLPKLESVKRTVQPLYKWGLDKSLQEANLAKWEAGEMKKHSKAIKIRDKRLQNLVSDYENRDTLGYLRSIAHNFDF